MKVTFVINPDILLENLEGYKENLRKRQADIEHFQLERIAELLKQKKELARQIQELQTRRNAVANTLEDSLNTPFTRNTQEGSADKGEGLRVQGKEIKKKIQEREEKSKEIQQELQNLALRLPNMLSSDVPVGKDESENALVREVGQKPAIENPKDYLELAGPLIDTQRASKVTGPRFGYLFGDVALLEFALIDLALETLLPKGFILAVPPVIIKPEVFMGMGRLTPEQKDERYHLDQDNLYLVGSAEHTLGPIHMDEVLAESELPKRYLGFSTCFRREAGSYGKDTKGILRVHQFDKVEMFSFAKPKGSEEEQQFLLACQEELMQKLELPYRVMQICSGDMGFTDYKAYDIDTWLPGQGKYRETHSCSNTSDFQARGVNVKYRPTTNDKRPTTNYVHMLNATALAIGRMIIAILENYQQPDGSVAIPKALQKYMGKDYMKLH